MENNPVEDSKHNEDTQITTTINIDNNNNLSLIHI